MGRTSAISAALGVVHTSAIAPSKEEDEEEDGFPLSTELELPSVWGRAPTGRSITAFINFSSSPSSGVPLERGGGEEGGSEGGREKEQGRGGTKGGQKEGEEH
jgi:hypothetical protein